MQYFYGLIQKPRFSPLIKFTSLTFRPSDTCIDEMLQCFNCWAYCKA